MKQSLKALNKEDDCFQYLCESFPGLSEEKLKAGIFDRLQIRKMKNDTQFAYSMTLSERTAWDMFITVINNFLGKKTSLNYKCYVANMLQPFQELGYNMSIKVHFLFSHLN